MTVTSVMRATITLFSSGVRQVLKDGMLLLLLPAPFLMGAALRFVLPFGDGILVRELGFSLRPWFPLSDALVMALTPAMTGMISAFLILDERDEGIGAYYGVTPAGGRAYLAARLGLPMLWAFISSLLVIGLFGLAAKEMAVIVIIAAALLGTLLGVIVCMLLAVLASNKVEGLALSKLANLLVLGLPAAWFVAAPYKYLFGFMPSFWLGEVMREGAANGGSGGLLALLLLAFAGVFSSVVWIAALTRAFLRRTR